MPRVTPQQVDLRALTAATRCIHQLFIMVNAQHLLEGNFSNLHELNDSFDPLLLYERRLKQLGSTRYVTPREHHSYSVWVYKLDLRKAYGEVPWLTDHEFLLKYRTTHVGVVFLLALYVLVVMTKSAE